AKRAAMALVDRLAPGDEVGVVAFSDKPQLVSPLSTDRTQTAAQLNALVANGNTALYDAVALSSDVLGSRRDRPHALVLLTDGEDYGSQLANGRAASLDRIRASGAQLDAFALGSQADTSYLADAAGKTQGGFWAVANDQALNDLFARLGDRLGAPMQIAIHVPPLTRGDHSLEIRARVDGQPAV